MNITLRKKLANYLFFSIYSSDLVSTRLSNFRRYLAICLRGLMEKHPATQSLSHEIESFTGLFSLLFHIKYFLKREHINLQDKHLSLIFLTQPLNNILKVFLV